MAAGLLLAAVTSSWPAAAAATEEPEPTLPGLFKATGELVIDRSSHRACLVAAPPKLTADITVIVDTRAGTVTGSIGNGAGSGRDTMTGCGDDPDERYIAEIQFSGIINGAVDRRTGTIEPFDVTMQVKASGESGWYPDMPEWRTIEFGGGFVCSRGGDGIVSACPLADIDGRATATMSGSVTADGELTIVFDWIAPYCYAEERADNVVEVINLPDDCPKRATITWSDLVVSNQRPVIRAVEVAPADPTTDDVITFTADAYDPDEDELDFTWSLDAEIQTELNAPSATWDDPTYGTHSIELVVSDPGGEFDEFAFDLFVAEPDTAAVDADEPDEADGTAPGDGDAPDSEEASDEAVDDDEEGAAGPGGAPTSDDPPGKGKGAASGGVAAVVLIALGEGLRRGWIRGKTREVYEKGLERLDRLERRQQEIKDRAQRRLEEIRGRLGKHEKRLRRHEKRLRRRTQKALQRLERQKARLLNKLKGRLAARLERAERRKAEVTTRWRRRAGETRDRLLSSRPVRRSREILARAAGGWAKLTRATSILGDPKARHRELDRSLERVVARRLSRMSGAAPLLAYGVTDPKAVARSVKRTLRDPRREIRRALRTVSSPRELARELRRAWRRVTRNNPVLRAIRNVFRGVRRVFRRRRRRK